MAPLAGMSKYWTDASALLPKGGEWEIRGVVKGPRQADPAIHGAAWTAWATGDDQRVEGRGDKPLLKPNRLHDVVDLLLKPGAYVLMRLPRNKEQIASHIDDPYLDGVAGHGLRP